MNTTIILKTILIILIALKVVTSKTLEERVSTVMVCVAVIAIILTKLIH